jgi:membrane fusion protein (multidrug efflux system)
MSEPVLKLAPGGNAPARREDAKAPPRRGRRRLRMLLLAVLPLLAALGGIGLYLSGGRYISTDNAYVGARKVLITPDISGKIVKVAVREGEHVNAGDELFELDPVPFRLALAEAQAKLATVSTEFANLKTNLKSLGELIELARKNVDLKQRDLDRRNALIGIKAASQTDVETAMAALVSAQNQLTQLTQQQENIRNQLLGNPDLPIEQYPAAVQAKAARDHAQRDLDHTVLRAPIGGTATQVDNIQLGRYVTAGTAVFSIVDDANPWVDANPKETDITALRIGQPVELYVDTFSDRVFRGRVVAVSPGTGAQFAILPPQNASGNWVKVVQRVPVRIAFDPGQDLQLLRAGLSVTVDIDTGRARSLAGLFGGAPVAAAQAPPRQAP